MQKVERARQKNCGPRKTVWLSESSDDIRLLKSFAMQSGNREYWECLASGGIGEDGIQVVLAVNEHQSVEGAAKVSFLADSVYIHWIETVVKQVGVGSFLLQEICRCAGGKEVLALLSTDEGRNFAYRLLQEYGDCLVGDVDSCDLRLNPVIRFDSSAAIKKALAGE